MFAKNSILKFQVFVFRLLSKKKFVGYKGILLMFTREIWGRDFQRIICRKSIRENIFVKYYEKEGVI